jgi:hypothetical protein
MFRNDSHGDSAGALSLNFFVAFTNIYLVVPYNIEVNQKLEKGTDNHGRLRNSRLPFSINFERGQTVTRDLSDLLMTPSWTFCVMMQYTHRLL